MAIVSSGAALQAYGRDAARPLSTPTSTSSSGIRTYGQADMATYAAIYAGQTEVRTVVDFLARNMAQLGLHVFRRVSDNDRERLAGHELASIIEHPNPATCRYKLMEHLMLDLGIYYSAYWLKLRGGPILGLARIPPEEIQPDGWLAPRAFYWTMPDGHTSTIAPDDLVYITGYSPFNPIQGLAPIETLRRLLCETAASNDYREAFWRNSARLEGVITRPAGAKTWTPEQKQSFREQWQARYSGQPGQVAVLEDGMTFTPMSQSARESEYVEGRKLTREECAAAYHIPQPMVGILDHATFSNVKEQHKQLYQDTLGPWCQWLQEEIERQVLPECRDIVNVYTEFNIQEKLKGSFEEQAAALQTLVGRPVMTPNEARARLNLPAIKDDPTADQLARPLNQANGGTPPFTAMPSATADVTPVIQRAWLRQRARLDKMPPTDRAASFDGGRWDRELAADLEACYATAGIGPTQAAQYGLALARTVNADTLQLLVAKEDAFSAAREAALYG